MTDKPHYVRVRGRDSEGSEEWRNREDPSELRLGWGQKSIQAKGLGTILALMLALLVGIEWYLANGQTIEHATLNRNLKDLIEVIDVQNWMLSMPQDKRPKLRKPLGADRYLLYQGNGGVE